MGKGWRSDGQGQPLAGEVAAGPRSPHHPRGLGPTSRRGPWGHRGTRRGTRGPSGNPPSPQQVLPPSTQGPRGACHPAPHPLGWRWVPSKPYHVDSQLQVLLVCFLLHQPLQGLEQSLFQQREHPVMPRQAPRCLPASPAPPASPRPSHLQEGRLEPLQGCQPAGRGTDPRWSPAGALLEALTPRGFLPPALVSFCFW